MSVDALLISTSNICLCGVIRNYRIRPNYRTVRLGFSKLLRTLICGKICIILVRIHYLKRSEKDI